MRLPNRVSPNVFALACGALLLTLPLTAPSAFARGPYAGPNSPPPDGVLVDLADDLDDDDIDDLAKEAGLRFVRSPDVVEGNRVEVHGFALDDIKRRLAAHDEVESIEQNIYYSLDHELNGLEHFHSDDDDDDDESEINKGTKPNDPMYKNQWHFNMVNAEGAWAKASGEGVVVAVIDTGVSPGKIKGKKSRLPRVPDLKDTEIVAGYNFVDGNDDPSDGNAHGTHVAGTIAQSTNNAYGVAGLAPKAKIMPIKVLSDRGYGSVGDIANGIRFAADNGAKVINMSLGGGMYSATLARAVKYAHDKGVVVACAAGNGGRKKVEYPAAYKGAFAVSALGPAGDLAFYSSYGKETDIAAPGGDTRVDLNGDGIPDGVLQNTIKPGDPSQHGFFPFQGTSMATPHVAAAAALVISTGVTDPDRVEKILQESAKELKDPIRYGAGGLDACAAVNKAHQNKNFFSLGLAGLAAVWVLRRNRKKDVLANFRVGPGFVGALVMGATGLFFLRDFGLFEGPLALLSSPPSDWVGVIFGQEYNATLVAASALLPMSLLAVFFSFPKIRGVMAGFALGTAGYLFARAGLGSVDVLGIPGHGLLDATWLVANGAVAVFLARVSVMRD
ncbi:MAG: peptidase S8 [Deltaproteobacteria bacterium]|nr:peptidase S8 [Deltaproteobacteria bacterium]